MTSIDHQILRLALPSIVSNITVPLLGLCDVTIMGHVGGASSIAAIAVGSMIFNVMYWLFVFLRMSTGGLTAQAYGAQQWTATRAVLRRSLTMALAFGVAMVLLQVPLQRLTFWLMQAEPAVEALCTPYFYICVWGAPAVLGLYVLTGWMVGMQNTRGPMLIAIAQNVLNIGLSLLLVIGFGMGLRGVAVGTLAAQWMGFLTGLGYVAWMLRQRSCASGAPEAFEAHGHPDGSGAVGDNATPKGSRTLHLDIFLRTVCLVCVNLYFTSAGAAQGALVLAGNTLLMQFFTIYSYMMDGFATAGEALAGRWQGAGDRAMLQLTVRRLFRWGVGVALLFTVAYALAGTPLLRLLTSDAAVVAQAQTYLPWAVLIPAAGMAAFVWDGIFIGTTRSRGMLAACFWAALAFFIVWWLLAPVWHNHALWLALIVYLAMRGAVQTCIYSFFRHSTP